MGVLIVGAGPTGLTLACELLRRNTAVRVVDAAPGRSGTSRALLVQPRTLEVLSEMGAADALIPQGTRATGARFYKGRQMTLHVVLPKLEGAFGGFLLVPQQQTELALLDLLRRRGGNVEYGVTLTGLRQGDGGVIAELTTPSGLETVGARFVAGCDGAHSRVRKACGVKFEGSTFHETFLLADVELRWRMPRDSTHVWMHPDGLVAAFPIPGADHWRLVVGLGAKASMAEPVVADLVALFSLRCGEAESVITGTGWFSVFHIGQRLASAYRVGNVFLAGDAAHIHSPFGGQGMNTGIQDAHNLAWKLSMVISGQAKPELLDTYQLERRPVARHVLRMTSLANRLVTTRSRVLRWWRDSALLPLASTRPLRRRIALQLSELDIGYRRSPLSRRSSRIWLPRRGPRVGDRAPGALGISSAAEQSEHVGEFGCTGFTLLGFCRTDERRSDVAGISALLVAFGQRWPTILRTCIITTSAAGNVLELPHLPDTRGALHRRYRATSGRLVLIRPDGYIAALAPANDAGTVEDFLTTWLRPGETSAALRRAVRS